MRRAWPGSIPRRVADVRVVRGTGGALHVGLAVRNSLREVLLDLRVRERHAPEFSLTWRPLASPGTRLRSFLWDHPRRSLYFSNHPPLNCKPVRPASAHASRFVFRAPCSVPGAASRVAANLLLRMKHEARFSCVLRAGTLHTAPVAGARLREWSRAA